MRRASYWMYLFFYPAVDSKYAMSLRDSIPDEESSTGKAHDISTHRSVIPRPVPHESSKTSTIQRHSAQKSEKESTPEKLSPKQSQSEDGCAKKQKSLEIQLSMDRNVSNYSVPPRLSTSMVIPTPLSQSEDGCTKKQKSLEIQLSIDHNISNYSLPPPLSTSMVIPTPLSPSHHAPFVQSHLLPVYGQQVSDAISPDQQTPESDFPL